MMYVYIKYDTIVKTNVFFFYLINIFVLFITRLFIQ